jgi:hypothetical protein
VVGLLTVWEYRRCSQLPLARLLRMVAAFGLLYALAEWGSLFVPNQERYLPSAITDSLWLLRVVLMVAAFGALPQFGIEQLPPRCRRRLRATPPIVFLVCFGFSVGGGGPLGDPRHAGRVDIGASLAGCSRYQRFARSRHGPTASMTRWCSCRASPPYVNLAQKRGGVRTTPSCVR